MKIKAIRVLLYAVIKVEDVKSVGYLLQYDDLERLGTVINETLLEIDGNMGK